MVLSSKSNSTPQFIDSYNGERLLSYEQYIYNTTRSDDNTVIKFWKCIRKTCSGELASTNYGTLYVTVKHNHDDYFDDELQFDKSLINKRNIGEIFQNNRGMTCLTFDQFCYRKNWYNQHNDRTYWNCIHRNHLIHCRGRIVSIGSPPVVIKVTEHNHKPTNKNI